MELIEKQGFKQTEVGFIPEDWKIIRLSEALFKEQLPSGLYKDKALYGRGTKIIKLGDVFAYDYYMPQFAQRVDISIDELISYTIKLGDLIVALASVKLEGVGKVLLVDKLDEPTVYDHNVALIRLDKNYDPKYFGHIFKSNNIRSQVTSKATQVGTTFLKASSLKKFNIPLPPTLTEQKAIATALSNVDELITNLEKLIIKKKAIKQGAMQQLLTPPHKGGKRLDGFTGEWEEIKLGEIADFYKGKGLPKSDIVEGGSYKCIHYGELFTKYNQIITNVKSRTNQNINVFLSKKNDVLMPTSDVTPNGLATASVIFENDIILGGDVLVIRPHKNLYGGFLSYQVSINKQQIMSLISGTTVFHLYGSDMAKFSFFFPDFEEQKAIVDIINDMDIEIKKLETKKTKYQSVKQGMMQELLTGKTRLA